MGDKDLSVIYWGGTNAAVRVGFPGPNKNSKIVIIYILDEVTYYFGYQSKCCERDWIIMLKTDMNGNIIK